MLLKIDNFMFSLNLIFILYFIMTTIFFFALDNKENKLQLLKLFIIISVMHSLINLLLTTNLTTLYYSLVKNYQMFNFTSMSNNA